MISMLMISSMTIILLMLMLTMLVALVLFFIIRGLYLYDQYAVFPMFYRNARTRKGG